MRSLRKAMNSRQRTLPETTGAPAKTFGRYADHADEGEIPDVIVGQLVPRRGDRMGRDLAQHGRVAVLRGTSPPPRSQPSRSRTGTVLDYHRHAPVSFSAVATSRAAVSTPPPGGKPTTNRTGLAGNAGRGRRLRLRRRNEGHRSTGGSGQRPQRFSLSCHSPFGVPPTSYLSPKWGDSGDSRLTRG